jgi:hypothetical protein
MAVSTSEEADRFFSGDLAVVDPTAFAHESVESAGLEVGSRLGIACEHARIVADRGQMINVPFPPTLDRRTSWLRGAFSDELH